MSRRAASLGVDTPRPFVLGTKVAPPPARPEHIVRERLFERLDLATARPLTLVAAPTGFGKTTLLSAWARRRGGRTAWVAITAGDSDTVRLMAAIVESVRRANALVDDAVDHDLASPGIDVTDDVLPRLLGAIDTSESLVLILDDSHLLSGAPAHDLVAALVGQMPESAHVVIATRADPVLPLGRLRATGAMDEIRSDELRFDLDEADRFLNGALGLALDPTSLGTLGERTEGWPAGLYLAALAMRSRPDRAAFVADFAGSSRHVVDYLSTEVLDGLSPDDREFLLSASILVRLSGPLCDAVTGMTGSAARLRRLERANLFIMPLDEQGTSYRFHRLFSELLRSQLAETSPGLELELHRRAATWHLEHGLLEAAVEHAVAAGDREWAARMLVRSWNDFLRIGQFQTLERLIALVGDAGGLTGPLAIVEGLVAGFLGRGPAVIRQLTAKAEAAGRVEPLPGEIPTDALAAVLVASFQADDLSAQRAAADYLMANFAERIEFLDLAGRVTLGLVLLLEGDPAGSLDVLQPIGLPTEAWNMDMSAAATRSLAMSDLGDAIEAERIARVSLDRAEGRGLGASRVGGSLWLALGNALAEQGRPREALPPLERALGSWGVAGTLHRAHVLIVLASTAQSVGDTARARAAAREARGILDLCPNAGSLPAGLAVVEHRLRIAVERGVPVGDRPSEAELRVLRLLASPLSTREIAGQLYLSIHTVKTHSKALHQKLGTSSRAETVARARERGLL